MTEQYLAKKTDLDRLNELITWYEQNKPSAGQRIQVRMSEDKLKKFAAKGEDGEWRYRGRVLERVAEAKA